jgi:hypothetical protein
MMRDRPIPRPIPIAADRPLSDELIGVLRLRVQAGFYDREDVVEAVARTMASRGDAAA